MKYNRITGGYLPLMAIFLLLMFMAYDVAATYITLTHTVTTEKIITTELSVINVTLLNSGDEPAYDVHMSLVLPEGLTSEDVFLGTLNPGIPLSGSFNVSVSPDLSPGEYAVGVLTEYKDANGYPLSSILSRSLIIRGVGNSQVGGMLTGLTLGEKQEKKISLEVRNFDTTLHEVKIKLFIPKQLKVTPSETTLTIQGQESETVDMDITTFGALPGSNYAVYAAMEYVSDGKHYSSTAGSMVKVVEYKETFSIQEGLPVINFGGWLPILAIVLLVAVLIVYQFSSNIRDLIKKIR